MVKPLLKPVISAQQLSERFGRIMQEGKCFHEPAGHLDQPDPTTRFCHSRFWDTALSSGEFVGMVADDLQEKIKLKMFHAEIKIMLRG